MNIAIVAEGVREDDGTGVINLAIAREAIGRGHNVTVLAADIAPELRDNRRVEWVRVPATRASVIRELAAALRNTDWLMRERRRFDVTFQSGFRAFNGCDVTGAHFLSYAWLAMSEFIGEALPGFAELNAIIHDRFNAVFERMAFKKARVVVAVSQAVRSELLRIGLDQHKIQVITNGVDCSTFKPGPFDRKKLGLPEGVPLALFVGDLHSNRKNVGTMIRAVAAVEGLHLAIVGDEKGTRYPALVEKLGVEKRVHFLGRRRDTPELMRASDVFLLVSHYEPFGAAILQAMASGVPVVTTVNVGASSLIKPGSGIVMERGVWPETIAANLKRIFASPEKRIEMGREARAIAEQHDIKLMASRYVDIFEQLSEAKSTKVA